jgi:hypothetical protein
MGGEVADARDATRLDWRRRVPEPDCLVVARRRQRLPVRRECHGPGPTRMALERAARRPRRRVPEPGCLVVTRRRQSLPVR